MVSGHKLWPNWQCSLTSIAIFSHFSGQECWESGDVQPANGKRMLTSRPSLRFLFRGQKSLPSCWDWAFLGVSRTVAPFTSHLFCVCSTFFTDKKVIIFHLSFAVTSLHYKTKSFFRNQVVKESLLFSCKSKFWSKRGRVTFYCSETRGLEII